MSDVYVEREFTSFGPESENRCTTIVETAVRSEEPVLYTPHVFDFIVPTRAADRQAKLYIPPLYLDADTVDSSKSIGRGASFVVSRRYIPPGPEFSFQKADMGTWTAEQRSPAAKQPECIVYKTCSIHFERNGEPRKQDRRSAESVLTEMHFLSHEALLKHENIVDYLGLAWGSNPHDPSQKLPVVVVEYADCGSLAAVQDRSVLTGREKREFSLDIARGLAALHEVNLVHGDVKADNVLVFSKNSHGRRWIAKIADFGFSLAAVVETETKRIGGTRPWMAPETSGAIPVNMLHYTDIFSFGLLCWSIAIDGHNPFTLVLPPNLPSEQTEHRIEEIKANNLLIDIARSDAWWKTWVNEMIVTRKSQSSTGQGAAATLTRDVRGVVTLMKDIVTGFRSDRTSVPPSAEFISLTSEARSLIQNPEPETALAIFLKVIQQGMQYTARDTIYLTLKKVFEKSLGLKPSTRDLNAIVETLVIESTTAETTSTNAPQQSSMDGNGTQNLPHLDASKTSSEASEVTTPRETVTTATGIDKSSTITTITNHSNNTASFRRTLPTRTPTSIISHVLPPFANMSTFLSRAPESVAAGAPESVADGKQLWSSRGYKNNVVSWQTMRTMPPSVQTFIFERMSSKGGGQLLGRCASLMNGYGTEVNVLEACSIAYEAAETSHIVCRAYVYRLHKACGVEMPEDAPVSEWLYAAAHSGSRKAMEDLEEVAPERVPDLRYRLELGFAGVGANFFWPENMLNGLTQPDWVNIQFLRAQIKQVQDPSTIVVNKRGDYILHFLASCGQWQYINGMLDSGKFVVNQRNAAGETPLLCAVRACALKTCAMLLQHYHADASIAAHNGETPLHWIIRFPDELIEALGKGLLSNGANINAMTVSRISHSTFPSTLDVDFQLPGTPLAWAIHDNRLPVVSWLLKNGANPSIWDAAALIDPIQWAAYFHHHECLGALVDHLEKKHANSDSEFRNDPRHALFYGPLIQSAIHSADRFSMILRNGTGYLQMLHKTLDLLRRKTELVEVAPNLGAKKLSVLSFAVEEAHDEAVEYMCETGWRMRKDINRPCGFAEETPILRAVRWNRRHIFELLLRHGAEPSAAARNPYDEGRFDFTAFHILAFEGHNKDCSLAIRLHDLGIPIEGLERDSERHNETPLGIAVRKNSFKLADVYQMIGADINATSLVASFISSPHPLTILGHVIALNARYCSHRLRYLLFDSEAKGFRPTDFIVEPKRKLSALHRCALSYRELRTTQDQEITSDDFDMDSSREIMHELLQKYKTAEQLDMPSSLQGKTALHLAVETENEGAVQELVLAGASMDVIDENGATVLDLARQLVGRSPASKSISLWLESAG